MSILMQGYGVVAGAGEPEPPGSGLDTALGRASALIEPWAVVIPDGTLDADDRAALLGQYVPGVIQLGTIIHPRVCGIFGWLLQPSGEPLVNERISFYTSSEGWVESERNFLTGKREVAAVTDDTGYFTINLIWSSELMPVRGDSARYQVVCLPVGLNDHFIVPSTSSANLASLLP